MESWYKVALSEQDISDRKGISLAEEFAALFVANRGPKDAAMFDKVDDKPPCVCFFSPRAFRIAEILLHRYGAVECEKPMGHQVVLLVGNSDAMKVLFPSTS